MGCAELQGGRFPDSQELLKQSDVGIAYTKSEAANRS